MIYNNGTPYSDEVWQKWYAHKSNKEAFIEAEEAENEARIDQAIMDADHSHTTYRK